MSEDLIVIEKAEVKEFIKNLIQTAYELGENRNFQAKEHLKTSMEHLPLVTKENRN